MNTVFLDSTKQKAKANKYKFVWKPITLHNRLSDKVRSLLKTLGLEKDVPSGGIIPSLTIMKKLEETEELAAEKLVGGEKALQKMSENLLEYLLKTLKYEEKEAICGPNRNSYCKTDYSATAMYLKSDYYNGLGCNMHAAYSTQILVSNGFTLKDWEQTLGMET